MMGKELIVLLFGWELWVKLGVSSSTGIQSALQEEVICYPQDRLLLGNFRRVKRPRAWPAQH